MDDAVWFDHLLTILGGHLGRTIPRQDDGLYAFEDEHGRVAFVMELSPSQTHVGLFAPIGPYEASPKPEVELLWARTLLELNTQLDDAQDYIICADAQREQYLVRTRFNSSRNPRDLPALLDELLSRSAGIRNERASGLAQLADEQSEADPAPSEEMMMRI